MSAPRGHPRSPSPARSVIASIAGDCGLANSGGKPIRARSSIAAPTIFIAWARLASNSDREAACPRARAEDRNRSARRRALPSRSRSYRCYVLQASANRTMTYGARANTEPRLWWMHRLLQGLSYRYTPVEEAFGSTLQALC